MIEYHANLGGLWWWILIKFCKTKLSDEQTNEKRRRNLYFLFFINIIFVSIATIFLIYLIYF
jgi:hypothetical protein